jgi:hypothetical protein
VRQDSFHATLTGTPHASICPCRKSIIFLLSNHTIPFIFFFCLRGAGCNARTYPSIYAYQKFPLPLYPILPYINYKPLKSYKITIFLNISLFHYIFQHVIPLFLLTISNLHKSFQKNIGYQLSYLISHYTCYLISALNFLSRTILFHPISLH